MTTVSPNHDYVTSRAWLLQSSKVRCSIERYHISAIVDPPLSWFLLVIGDIQADLSACVFHLITDGPEVISTDLIKTSRDSK